MIQRPQPALVLASASAARQALLAAAGLSFEVLSAEVDEAAIRRSARADGTSPTALALVLADAKASRVAAQRPAALVIGADQLLVCDGDQYDKPADLTAARRSLQAMRGREHTLVTAVVCWQAGQPVWRHVAEPRLSMRAVSDGFLDAYLEAEGAAVLPSVGAYRLEGLGVHLFSAVQGEHAAILGLPMLPLLDFLREVGAVLR